MKTTDKKKHW